jgi:hypothetical protein
LIFPYVSFVFACLQLWQLSSAASLPSSLPADAQLITDVSVSSSSLTASEKSAAFSISSSSVLASVASAVEQNHSSSSSAAAAAPAAVESPAAVEEETSQVIRMASDILLQVASRENERSRLESQQDQM